MISYRPVKTNFITQNFGENKACAKVDVFNNPIRPFVIITKTGDFCPIGYKPFYPLIGLKSHNGQDLHIWHGEPIYFPVDCEEACGWWSREASDLDGGLGVDVVSNQKVFIPLSLFQNEDHLPQSLRATQNNVIGYFGYVKMRFWHLKLGWKDSIVNFGDLIGYGDNTGASSGDHLHYSFKFCDEKGDGIGQDNGYAGAFWLNTFENEFVLDVLKVKGEALSAIDKARSLILSVKLWISSKFGL